MPSQNQVQRKIRSKFRKRKVIQGIVSSNQIMKLNMNLCATYYNHNCHETMKLNMNLICSGASAQRSQEKQSF